MSDLKDLYEQKYLEAKFTPFVPNPDAVTTSRLDDVFRLLRGNTGRLLEIGSGSGAFSMAIADQFDQVTGIELAEVRVALAREALQAHYPRMVDKVDFVAGNADELLPFADKSFDSVVACAVLEHVIDVYNFMDEAARVCKPGGTLIVTVPNVAYIKHVIGLLFGKLPLTGSPRRDVAYWREHGWDGAHFHYFTKETLGDLLRHTGFEPLEWTSDGKFAKYRRWGTNLSGNLTVRARRVADAS